MGGPLLAELVREGGKVADSLPWSDAGGASFNLTGHALDAVPLQGAFTRARDWHWTGGVLPIEVEPLASRQGWNRCCASPAISAACVGRMTLRELSRAPILEARTMPEPTQRGQLLASKRLAGLGVSAWQQLERPA